jgi:hypothetical protein
MVSTSPEQEGKPMIPSMLRSAAAWLFIVLVALFLTHPTAEQQSVFDGPLPLPAELEPLLPG